MVIDGFGELVEIGRGGLGVVYSAIDATGGRVAIKVLTESLEDGAAFGRLQREVGAMAQLRGHPNVVHVYRADRLPTGQPYLVMELAEAGSLRDLLKRNPGGLPTGDVARWGSEIAEALTAAHQIGIIHRDVKPDNAFLTKYGHIKLGDFGVALLAWDPLFANRTMAEASSMTIAHGAPEQFDETQPVGPPADIYALGSTLYELSEGTPPFGKGALRELFTVAERKRNGPANLTFRNTPVQLARYIQQCLDPNPAARPSADNLVDHLANLTGNTDRTITRNTITPPPPTTPLPFTTNPPSQPPPVPVPAPAVFAGGPPGYITNPPTQPQVIYVTQGPGAPPPKSRGAGMLLGALIALTVALAGAAIFFATRTTTDASTSATTTAESRQPTTVAASTVATTVAIETTVATTLPLGTSTAPTVAPTLTPAPTSAATAAIVDPAPATDPPPPTEPPRIAGDLGLATPMSQPACDGNYITVVSSIPAAQVAAILQTYPDAAYLRTETTCPSLSARFASGTHAGEQIYIVYYGPYSQADACANRALGPSDAYAKRLDTTSPPGHAVAC